VRWKRDDLRRAKPSVSHAFKTFVYISGGRGRFISAVRSAETPFVDREHVRYIIRARTHDARVLAIAPTDRTRWFIGRVIWGGRVATAHNISGDRVRSSRLNRRAWRSRTRSCLCGTVEKPREQRPWRFAGHGRPTSVVCPTNVEGGWRGQVSQSSCRVPSGRVFLRVTYRN